MPITDSTLTRFLGQVYAARATSLPIITERAGHLSFKAYSRRYIVGDFLIPNAARSYDWGFNARNR